MIVLVHGYDGSGPGHWQRWLDDELRRRDVPALFPELPDPTAPQCAAWVAMLADLVRRARRPVTFVAHSLGCWAVDHLIAEYGTDGIAAALLVAPPSPYLLFEPVESFLPPPLRREAWQPIAARSLLVGSDNDEFTSPEEVEEIAAVLGIACRILPGAGHINPDAGFGPWPFAVEWLQAGGMLDP